MTTRRRALATTLALIAVAGLSTAGPLAGCGRPAPTPSPLPSPTATAMTSPSPTSSKAFEPYPPGKASATQALAVGREYAVRSTAKTVSTANVLAPDSTLDIWLADEAYRGAETAAYFDATTGAAAFLGWAPGTVLATAGAAVVETVVTNTVTYPPLVLPIVQLLVVDGHKITHFEVYGNDLQGEEVGRPRPLGSKPGPFDDAAAVKRVVSAYYAALGDRDVAATLELYSPHVVFQDTTHIGPAGSRQAAIDWHTALAAVQDWSLQLESLIAGDGWALARWVLSGTDAAGRFKSAPGAAVFEVRDGSIARQTLYYVAGDTPLP